MLRGGLMGCCDRNKGGGSGTSVQIFVCATDREIDRMKIEGEFYHADGMTEIPHHQRAGVVKLSGDGGDVEQCTGAIIDVREHGDRDLSVKQGLYGRAIRADQSPLHRTTRGLHCAFDDIEVRRKRFVLGNDDVAIGPHAYRSMDRLVKIDRCGVANQRLTGRRPDQSSDAVAEPDWHVEPSGGIPTPDEVIAPLLFDRTAQDACRGARHRTERIPVEINEAFGYHKTVAEVAERINAIARYALIARRHGG